MRCFGEFKDDRTCDMCLKIDYSTYTECKQARMETISNNKKLSKIREQCPYRQEGYNATCGTYYICKQRHEDSNRDIQFCNVNSECEKFFKKLYGNGV